MKQAFLIFGLSMMLATYLTFAFIFLGAYFSPSKSALININQHGEADIELIMLLGSFPFALFTVWTVLGWLARN